MDPTAPMDPTAAWLESASGALVEVAKGSLDPTGGFGYLGDDGTVDPDRAVELYITCRMTHVFALAEMRGDTASATFVEHGLEALRGRLRDHEYGGWLAAVGPGDDLDPTKAAYAHAFVILATASAASAGHRDARHLLDEALGVFDTHFWVEDEGAAIDAWDRVWVTPEAYRGANANMHVVEALLGAFSATGESVWRDRALRITTRLIHGEARSHGWRLPEHYDSDWRPLPDFNRERPADPFRPYGATIGHLLEWARLCLHLRTALGPDHPAAGWLLEDARALMAQAVADGWSVDGAEGFVYTVDYDGTPVVRDRMHWVVAEGIAAAWELWVVTREERYLQWYQRWWTYAQTHLIDPATGSWQHELDPSNQPSATVWPGRPDVYHAYQATLLPLLGDREIVSFAGGCSG